MPVTRTVPGTRSFRQHGSFVSRFVPSDLSEVYCWLQADGGSNVLNGSAAAASDGETVDSWISEVGSFTFQNVTDSQRPVFKNDGTGAGNKPYLLFDGTDDRLVRNGTFSSDTTGELFFVVNRTDGTADFTGIFGLGLSSLTTPWLAIYHRADSAGAAVFIDTDSTAIVNSDTVFRSGPTYLVNLRHDDTNISFYKNRVAIGTPAAQSWFGDLSSHDRATIGGLTRTTFTFPFKGKVYELIFCNAVLSDVNRARVLHYLQNKYNPLMTFAALGDSITARTGASGWWSDGSNPSHLDAPTVEGVGFVEHAAGNETTLDALNRWNTEISGAGYDGVVILSTVNDFDGGAPFGIDAAASFARLETIIDEALDERLRVFASTIMPWGNAGGWNTARQAAMQSYNGLIRNKAAADRSGFMHLVEAYDNFGEPTDATKLLAAYDSGDGVHPNTTGATAFANLLKTQIEAMR